MARTDWKKLMLELVVVFLGVTAGFLLNNWQLKRQDDELENKYLNGFLQDVNNNIKELENAYASDSLWLEMVNPQLKKFAVSQISVDTANILIQKVVNISRLDTYTSAYEDIINSGKINIVKNFDLKKQIVDYHIAIKGVKFIEDFFYDYFLDVVNPFIFKRYNIVKSRLVDPEVRNSPAFVNIIGGYYSLIQQRSAAYKELLNKSYLLKKSLLSEISK